MVSSTLATLFTLWAVLLLLFDAGPRCLAGRRFLGASILALSTALCATGSLARLGWSWATVLLGAVPVAVLAVAALVLVRFVAEGWTAHKSADTHMLAVELHSRPHPSRPDVRVVDSALPLAYAVPGARAVVVSTAVLDALSPTQWERVLAHELTHVRNGHHWWLAMASACAPVLPRVADRMRAGVEAKANCAAARSGSHAWSELAAARSRIQGVFGLPAQESEVCCMAGSTAGRRPWVGLAGAAGLWAVMQPIAHAAAGV